MYTVPCIKRRNSIPPNMKQKNAPKSMAGDGMSSLNKVPKSLQTTTNTLFHLIWHIHQISQSSVHIIAALFQCHHNLKLSIESEDNLRKYNVRKPRRIRSPDCIQNSYYAFLQEIQKSIRTIKTSECPVVPRHETECPIVPRHERKCPMMESHVESAK